MKKNDWNIALLLAAVIVMTIALSCKTASQNQGASAAISAQTSATDFYPYWEETWRQPVRIELTAEEKQYLSNSILKSSQILNPENNYASLQTWMDEITFGMEEPGDCPPGFDDVLVRDAKTISALRSDAEFMRVMEARIYDAFTNSAHDSQWCGPRRGLNAYLMLNRISRGLQTPEAYRFAALSLWDPRDTFGNYKLAAILLRETIRRSRTPLAYDYLLLGKALEHGYVPSGASVLSNRIMQIYSAYDTALNISENKKEKAISYLGIWRIYRNTEDELLEISTEQSFISMAYNLNMSLSNNQENLNDKKYCWFTPLLLGEIFFEQTGNLEITYNPEYFTFLIKNINLIYKESLGLKQQEKYYYFGILSIARIYFKLGDYNSSYSFFNQLLVSNYCYLINYISEDRNNYIKCAEYLNKGSEAYQNLESCSSRIGGN